MPAADRVRRRGDRGRRRVRRGDRRWCGRAGPRRKYYCTARSPPASP